MTTDTNTKIVWAVVVLIVVSGLVYAFLPAKNNTQQKAQEAVQNPSLVLQGTVTGVDAEKMQITIDTVVTKVMGTEKIPPPPVSTTIVGKTVVITPATKIEKIISQKNAKGEVEKQGLAEVNIGDVQKGTQVTVVYESEKDGVLSGVSQVSFVVEANIEEYFTAQAANQTPYIKGQVVAVDIAGKSLSYNPYFFNTLATTTTSVAFTADIPVYEIDDPNRVAITYARTVATLADIRSGQTIFIAADPAALKTGKVVAQAFIISAK